MVTLKIDKNKCISAQSCLVFAPKTLALDKDGKAYIKNPQGNSEAELMQAAQSCPVDAIEVFDEKGQKLWPKN